MITTSVISGCSRLARTHIARGDADFDTQAYADAIDEYDQAARFLPDDPHLIGRLGLAHKAMGHRRDAYAYLEKARQLNPNDTLVRVTLASMYLNDGLFDRAIAEADSVLAVAPRNLDAMNTLGSTYLARGDRVKATETFRKIAEFAPRDGRSHYLVGLGLLAEGKTSAGEQSFQTALTFSPSLIDPLAQLVQLDIAAKKPDIALARLRKQMAIVGDSARFHLLLGNVYFARGQRELAEAELHKAITLDPRSAAANSALSDLYLTEGKYDEALALAASSLTAVPGNLNMYVTQGVVYERRGDIPRAKAAYEQALAINPRFVAAANNLAMLLAEEPGSQQRALELARTAQAASPGDPRIGDTFGWILYKSGDYAGAVKLLAKVAQQLPTEPTVAYHLGVARQRAGDSAGARVALSRAVNSPASFPEKQAAQKALAAMK
jgi:tetratricopeptide (TPR) repeat protein